MDQSSATAEPVMTFRRATNADRAFIKQMHLEAETWGNPNKELPESFADIDRLYVDEWSEEQGGIIAEEDGTPIGAAWLRLFSADRPGTAFISEDIPELAIGLVPGNTGKGLGRKLLEATLQQAREDGRPAVSLCVAQGNDRALHLYEKLGFQHRSSVQEEKDVFDVMVYSF